VMKLFVVGERTLFDLQRDPARGPGLHRLTLAWMGLEKRSCARASSFASGPG
jgi:hypothetical protein